MHLVLLLLRMLLAFILIPMLQKQLDIFRTVVWNSHRIRFQRDTVLPDGIPDHMFNFPEKYGLEECSMYFIISKNVNQLSALHLLSCNMHMV